MSATNLKHGTGLVAEKVAEKTLDAASDIAERAKKQAEALAQVAESAAERLPGRKAKPKRRGRKVVGTLLALGAAAFAAVKGRRILQQRREPVIDLDSGMQAPAWQSTSMTSSSRTTA